MTAKVLDLKPRLKSVAKPPQQKAPWRTRLFYTAAKWVERHLWRRAWWASYKQVDALLDVDWWLERRGWS